MKRTGVTDLGRAVAYALLAVVLLLIAGAHPAGALCTGDCDEGGTVTVNELVLGVGIALDAQPTDACVAMDANIDTGVSVDELVTAVQHALRGCDAQPTPTATVTPTPALCGDPTLMERLGACRASQNEGDCIAAGGRWARDPFNLAFFCFCPTGQAECPCARQADCVNFCIAPRVDGQCSDTAAGICSAEAPPTGCFCQIDADGQVSQICS